MAAAAGDVSDTISRRFVFLNVFTATRGGLRKKGEERQQARSVPDE